MGRGDGGMRRSAACVRRAACAAAVLLVGCGASSKDVYVGPGGSGQPADSGSPARTFQLTNDDLPTIVGDVVVARQLKAERPISLQLLSKTAFIEQFRATNEARSTDRAEREAAFRSAFNLGSAAKPGPDEDALIEKQLLGFYDLKRDMVFVPIVPEPTEDKLLIDKAIVAHEVEHALQVQHFKGMREPKSSDEALAILSLIEGDAQVAMGAYLGKVQGAPVGRTLRRIVDATKDVPVSALARSDGEQDHALARVRERLDFPYDAGMLFVSDLYRAGGFSLVNQAFADPPSSSAQILHPEKYLRGEDPRSFAAIKAPAGWSVVSTDTLGELDTSILLQRCMSTDVAGRAADGWAGDRYVVLDDAKGHIALAWASAWTSEAEAQEMESALLASDGCWRSSADADASSRVVTRQRDVVVLVRGLDGTGASAVRSSLFAAVAAPKAPKARSTAKIPQRVPLPEPEKGHVTGDVYDNDWLGVVGRVPPGLTAEVGADDDDLFLTITRPGTIIYGAIGVSTRISNAEQNEKTFQEAQRAFSRGLAKNGATLSSQGTSETTISLGAAIERDWAISGGRGTLRMFLVPICAGTGSIVVVEGSGDGYARKVLDEWIGSFRFKDGRNLRACDYLDPK